MQQADIGIPKNSLSTRILWLDFAKSYGMILVFLGHILESLSQHDFTSAFLTYKAIYSFHIPLFFLLSGYISKPPKGSFAKYISIRISSRIVPFVFFNILGLMGRILLDLASKNLNFTAYLSDSLSLLRGVPAFNITTWFLACLFAVEVVHFVVCRILKSERSRLLAAALLFGLGWFVTLENRELAMNLWFFPEAMVAYIFYISGSVLRHSNYFNDGDAKPESSISKDAIGFWVSFIIMLLTFNLNESLFYHELPKVVFMGLSSHGQPLLFLITGLAGSLATIYLARWSASSQSLSSLQNRLGIKFIGLNTLVLLGLNGLLMPFNYKLAGKLASVLPDQPFIVLPLSLGLAAISLAICVPLVLGLKRFLPQFVGLYRPSAKLTQ